MDEIYSQMSSNLPQDARLRKDFNPDYQHPGVGVQSLLTAKIIYWNPLRSVPGLINLLGYKKRRVCMSVHILMNSDIKSSRACRYILKKNIFLRQQDEPLIMRQDYTQHTFIRANQAQTDGIVLSEADHRWIRSDSETLWVHNASEVEELLFLPC